MLRDARIAASEQDPRRNASPSTLALDDLDVTGGLSPRKARSTAVVATR
jgi:hypothetical protein